MLFWEMTYGEVIDLINIYIKNENKRQKEQASLIYKLSDLIGYSINCLFSQEAKFPTINQAFPGLFEAEENRAKEIEENRQVEIFKAKFSAFAEHHNKKRGEKLDS